MKNDLTEFNKKFYTHIFVMIISLTFLLIVAPGEITLETKHPFFTIFILAFLFSLGGLIRDYFRKTKVEKDDNGLD